MKTLTLHINGSPRAVPEGITVAAALRRSGVAVFGLTAHGGARDVFCGMGQCQACRVRIDGQDESLACMRLVADGMRVETLA
ncbi:(2Fe-2S)-binding protein [Pelomonas sp. APW6]|uniref:(2Fe-2S)-binding protein n=1 Tax=Roseateles subflavus TaxID=3053353 RepID=A0ABT7LJ33_9BURK|nr:(2Fe-2S)-binding protein [Pelomonas sp. APW6]MDL5032454.1 (2Fe-2S)-binding protein [Pelomonas sp. APW6]